MAKARGVEAKLNRLRELRKEPPTADAAGAVNKRWKP